ncbi:MAG TPA: hypothetical protein VK466_14840 [Terriglobales bacterium]|nr:hypothetical protein [Terriglobales bacterium]
MPRRDFTLRRLLLSLVACVLIGGVFASEIPEELTLTNDTSNDYILRSPTAFKGVQLAPSFRESAEFSLISVNSKPTLHFSPTALETPEPHGGSLFILHSVLRT